MVYPALLAAVGDVAHPTWRATSVGVYRFWRDLGYAVSALMAGVVASMLGLVWAVHVAGILTALSGLLAWALMNETLPGVGTIPNTWLGSAAAGARVHKTPGGRFSSKVRMTNTIETGTLREWLEAQQPVTVLDVRSDEDRAQ